MPLLHDPLTPPHGSAIYYQGPGFEAGALPAVLFFALSGQMSLFQDPFNQPVLRWIQQGIRVFSWDLPFHGPTQDPHEAMQQWASEFLYNPSFISNFLDLCQLHIQYLIDRGLVDPQQLAVAGLSRGGFIATHLAARDPRLKAILGFAPLTHPQPLEELKGSDETVFHRISLLKIADHLIHRPLRFYIGNRDQRVGTDACYQFIHHLTETAFNGGIRSPLAELIIYPSVGHKGHGTPPSIFQDGADWMTLCLKADSKA